MMSDFKSLSYLPQYSRAADGAFLKMQKPMEFGHAYPRYKRYPAILVLGYVDAREFF